MGKLSIDRHRIVTGSSASSLSRLSLQRHHHRSEHWIVVRGAARVTVKFVKIVHANESVYIPIDAVHRLEIPARFLPELIEVQTGSYFGEDDIIRIEDDYQRS